MAIELKEVYFHHPEAPDVPVLQVPYWSVNSGQRVFVHGPSGSGKSTLLNLVSGLLVCPTGEISVLGERLDLMNRRKRDRFRVNNIGYVFQRFNLISYLNPIENIELAKSFSARQHRNNSAVGTKSLLESLNVEAAGGVDRLLS